ncbi:MAG: hypothetical protein SVV67_00195 [Bacillota bacterium]|nr:hypothetical protein [Bacillota bacterium]
MAESGGERYMVSKPIYESEPKVNNIKRFIYLSSELISGSNCYVSKKWIYGIPDPNPHIPIHAHEYDQILLYMSIDPEKPQVLGGEVEITIGGQQLKFNTTTGIFIPKELGPGNFTWKEVSKPHLVISFILASGSYRQVDPEITGQEKGKLLSESGAVDYEKYVVRSPLREITVPGTTGRQDPSMSYISKLQIPEANYYLEYGWVYKIPDPNPGMHEHSHDFDEVVLHFGSDPDHPTDLGGEFVYYVDEQPLTFNTSNCGLVAKNLKHGPLTRNECSRAQVEMALMVGAGSFSESWDNSGIRG